MYEESCRNFVKSPSPAGNISREKLGMPDFGVFVSGNDVDYVGMSKALYHFGLFSDNPKNLVPSSNG